MREVQLPPRVEPVELKRSLLTPCKLADDVPLPTAKATPRAAAIIGKIITDERDCDAWKLDQIRAQPGIKIVD